MILLTILCYDNVFRSLVRSSSDRRPRAPPPLDCVAHGCNHTVVFGLYFDRQEFEDYRRQENVYWTKEEEKVKLQQRVNNKLTILYDIFYLL